MPKFRNITNVSRAQFQNDPSETDRGTLDWIAFFDYLEFQSKNEFLKQLQEENSKLESIESYLKDFKAVDGVDTQEEYEEVKG